MLNKNEQWALALCIFGGGEKLILENNPMDTEGETKRDRVVYLTNFHDSIELNNNCICVNIESLLNLPKKGKLNSKCTISTTK